jgi:hypothetical protein
MRKTLLTALFCLLASAAISSDNNQALKGCLEINGYTPKEFETFNFSKAAGCYQNYKSQKNAEELAELRDFLKHNPRYKVPGQSLNRCWGKPREMPFESAYIKKSGNGFEAGINYKDSIPAGCYENAPWDNRKK